LASAFDARPWDGQPVASREKFGTLRGYRQ
jgi:hypothetical protein